MIKQCVYFSDMFVKGCLRCNYQQCNNERWCFVWNVIHQFKVHKQWQ